jgi:hypothetical protein
VQPGIPSDQRRQFGAAKDPDPAVTLQRQPLIQGKVGDREGEGPIHGRTNGEHRLGFQPGASP